MARNVELDLFIKLTSGCEYLNVERIYTMSYDPAKAQARVLLQALCKFIVPVIQTALRQNRIDVEKLSSGPKADELVVELEKFISGMISRSRPPTKDIAIEGTLRTHSIYRLEGLHLKLEITSLRTNFMILNNIPYWNVPLPPAVPFELNNSYTIARPISDPEEDKKVSEELQKLRKEINQKMPIRLLCLEPHDSKVKITLLERNEIYDRLAPKVRADLDNGKSTYWKHTRYAILSHTWTQAPGELTYGDWKNGSLDNRQPKCQKLINFCSAAWKDHGLALGWIDTMCINKESSAELDESIRSMYAWYRNAEVCITYLAGTSRLSDMHNDPWFTRGWTLQELVAPTCIKFYNKHWIHLSLHSSGTNTDTAVEGILKEISLATTITSKELLSIRDTSISRRMQLAAKRQVTREEDFAYCLMGIFDVSISTAYGEGAERAFFRLVEEIFRSTKDISDIFNWAGDRGRGSRKPITSLFPSRPSDYLNRSSNEQLRPWRPIEPLTLTHLGLRTPILLMSAVPIQESVSDYQPLGDYHATIFIAPFKDIDEFEVPKNYHLLDKRCSGPESLHQATSLLRRKTSILTFGTLNVEEQGSSIHIPKTCLAVLLQLEVDLQFRGRVIKTSSPVHKRLYTEKPIVFNLEARNVSDDNRDKDYYEIKRTELGKHGMELVTLYL